MAQVVQQEPSKLGELMSLGMGIGRLVMGDPTGIMGILNAADQPQQQSYVPQPQRPMQRPMPGMGRY